MSQDGYLVKVNEFKLSTIIDQIISTTSIKIDRASVDLYDMILINRFEDNNIDMLIILSNFVKVYISNSFSSSWNVAHASNMKIEGNNLE